MQETESLRQLSREILARLRELSRATVEGTRDTGTLLGEALAELAAVQRQLERLEPADESPGARAEAGTGRRQPLVYGGGIQMALGIPARPPAPETRERERRADPLAGPTALSGGAGDTAALARSIEANLYAALYAGDLDSGDRVPGVRETSRRTGINHKPVGRVFRALESEGLLEVRDRSGVYVADLRRTPEGPLDAVGELFARVLAESREVGITVRDLADSLGGFFRDRPLRCACVESVGDDAVALCAELREHFGMRVMPAGPEDPFLSAKLGAADLVVTTPFHVRRVRRSLPPEVPLLVVQRDSRLRSEIRERLREGECSIVCLDPAFGERARALLSPEEAERVRVLGIEDRAEAPDALVTRAARDRLSGSRDLPAACDQPFLARASVREISQLVVRLWSASGPPAQTERPATGGAAAPDGRMDAREDVLYERSVLLAEDDRDTRDVYATALRLAGYRVIEAADGEEAVSLARQEVPDAVVMDLGLPLVDGWEATETLKRDPATAHVPVIAISVFVAAAFRERTGGVGCDSFLEKPFAPTRLLGELARLTHP